MLVSAICPTADRHIYLPLALRCFQRQTYLDRELVIVDNGVESVEPLLEQISVKETEGLRVVYQRLDPKQYGKLTHGQMMNECVAFASGEIILAWDDDDWSCPERMESQIDALNKTGKSLTGYSEILYYDTRTGGTFKYKYNGIGYYACGSSQCFTRELWEHFKFPNKVRGADGDFCKFAREQNELLSIPGVGMMVARTHSNNSWHPPLGNAQFPAYSREEFPKSFFEDMASCSEAAL